ncbi:MAG: hypothetical protein ACOCTG_02115, partial [Bacteroidota bacterium]
MKPSLLFAALVVSVLLVSPVLAQEQWTYLPEATIHFSDADSLAAPYLGAYHDGALWIVSSAQDSLYRNTYKNALYRWQPGDAHFVLIDDYTNTGVWGPSGIDVHDGDVYVASRIYVEGDPYFNESMIMRYAGGEAG